MRFSQKGDSPVTESRGKPSPVVHIRENNESSSSQLMSAILQIVNVLTHYARRIATKKRPTDLITQRYCLVIKCMSC